MSTIRPASTGTIEERLRRVEQALHVEEELHCANMVNPAPITSTAPLPLQRWSIPMIHLRQLLPEDRWTFYAAGVASCAGPFTLQLGYTPDLPFSVILASQTFPATDGKLAFGPIAARGPLAPSVPLENVAIYGLLASVASAAQPLTLTGWTYWMRMTPRST